MSLKDNRVALNFVNTKKYPQEIPFDPPERYPENKGNSLNPDNQIYAGFRDILYRLGLDHDSFNTKNWNPFKEIIKPGMTVFIKPNIVVHAHGKKKDIFSAIVHGSILRPILDYVCIALKNEGRIIIGDSPLIFSHFDKAMAKSQIKDLLEWYVSQTPVSIECMDLRTNRGVRTWLFGKWGRISVEQDQRGYQFVDLGDQSFFKDIDPKRIRIAIASHKNMYKHHSNGKHEYLFPRSFLESDAVISIPKLKTHRRTAITLALKNFMGIPALKDSLPHFITGSVEEGGDQYLYPSLRKRIVTKLHDQIQANPFIPAKFLCALTEKIIWNSCKIFPFKDDINEAMWYGNVTLWRTLLDLNRIVLYADKHGEMRETQQRSFFGLIDGITAGERDGPVAPDPVSAGVLLAGFNPVAIDAVGSVLMGFDFEKIPIIRKGLEDTSLFSGTKDDIQVIDGDNILKLSEFARVKNLKFEPHPNWKGHVELE